MILFRRLEFHLRPQTLLHASLRGINVTFLSDGAVRRLSQSIPLKATRRSTFVLRDSGGSFGCFRRAHLFLQLDDLLGALARSFGRSLTLMDSWRAEGVYMLRLSLMNSCAIEHALRCMVYCF